MSLSKCCKYNPLRFILTSTFFQVVYKSFVNLHGRLLLMVQWSLLAYTGICKILKKHHKRTGLLVMAPQLQNLLAQPFCSIEVVISILAHVCHM